MKKLVRFGWLLASAVFSVLIVSGTSFSESLIFSDSFDNGLSSSRWTAGYNAAWNKHSEGPAFTVENGKLAWHQAWDYIESTTSFQGDFRVEVDVESPSSHKQCIDFAVELVEVPDYSGAFRFRYGSYAYDGIELGEAPDYEVGGTNAQGICVSIHHDGSDFFREMATVQPYTGTLILTYQQGNIKFAFRNSQGRTIETPAAHVGDIAPTAVRIGSNAMFDHYVDAVRVYSLDGDSSDSCATVDLNTLAIDIPCVDVGGVKYKLRLIYDPSIHGGYYWKLDPSSLQPVD